MKIPHSKKLQADYGDFLKDLQTVWGSFARDAENDGAKFGMFKLCTASHTVLSAWGTRQSSLLLKAAGGCARRVLVLAVMREYSLARVQLRRLIECIVWYVYFFDHPVEWAHFQVAPGRGWGNRDLDPIAAAAAAEISMFFRYAKERFEADPSKLAKDAANRLHAEYGNLSAEVHAAVGAVHPSGSLALAFDPHDPPGVARFYDQSRAVFSDAVLSVSALNPKILNGLDAVDRAWFDWLVGKDAAKAVRGAPFGVQRNP